MLGYWALLVAMMDGCANVEESCEGSHCVCPFNNQTTPTLKSTPPTPHWTTHHTPKKQNNLRDSEIFSGLFKIVYII